jgi:hypothetical protein
MTSFIRELRRVEAVTTNLVGDISGSHGGEYEGDCLLGYPFFASYCGSFQVYRKQRFRHTQYILSTMKKLLGQHVSISLDLQGLKMIQ